MQKNVPHYRKTLSEVFTHRQKENPSYSLRTFAKEIDCHYSTLSLILNGKRSISKLQAEKICDALKLGPIERYKFIESTLSPSLLDTINISNIDLFDNKIILDESSSKVIAEWEHFAVLRLFDLDGFTVTTQNIASKLNVTVSRAEEVLSHLIASGFLSETDYGFERVYNYIRTTEDIPSSALRQSHIEALELGKTKLDEVDIQFRDFSSITLPVDLTKLDEAKTIIREFRQKMVALMKDGRKSEIYQVAIQLYPLSDITITEKK